MRNEETPASGLIAPTRSEDILQPTTRRASSPYARNSCSSPQFFWGEAFTIRRPSATLALPRSSRRCQETVSGFWLSNLHSRISQFDGLLDTAARG